MGELPAARVGQSSDAVTEQTRRAAGRFGRLMWGGIALLLLLTLVGSLAMSGSSVGAAEREAEAWAVAASSSVVETDLTPDLLSRDITGETYRDLIVRVQAGILSDDRVTVVRIWRIDGGLIFSTAQRDEVSKVSAGDDPWIAAAAGGQTVSVLSSVGTYHEGLKRPNEELFQTFVPIHLTSDQLVDGIVEVAQRYGAIRAEGLRVWRPVQFSLFALFIGAAILLGRAFRVPLAGAETSTTETASGGGRIDDRARRKAEARADKAERKVHEAEERVREMEGRLKEAQPGPEVGTRSEELELKLRASEAEREQQGAELQRLRASLAEREGDLVLAREGNGKTRAETKKASKQVAEADSRAAAAERKAADAERKAEEASKRATAAAERALEMEAQLGVAERKVAELGVEQAAAADKRRDSGERKIVAELKQTEAERDQLLAKLQDLEKTLAESRTKMQAQERELALRNHELALKNLELNTSAGAAAVASTLEERAMAAEVKLADSEERVVDARSRLAEAEAKLADALEKLGELERARLHKEPSGEHADAVPPAELAPRSGLGRSDLESRIAELENARRADVVELQRAQESFANTQVELSNATRKLRDAEARIRELQAVPAVEPDPRAESAPVPDYVVEAASEDPAISGDDAEVYLTPEDAGNGRDEPKKASPRKREATPQDEREEPVVEEGLSLRERLARAAAGRRRGPLS
jgi:hypothetical protein